MNAPADLNPLICDALVDTLFTASCAVRFLARAAEDRTHVCTAQLTRRESAGEAFIMHCIAAALDYAEGQQRAGGSKA